MATTLKLQNTVNWAKPYLKNAPLDFSNMDPALTTANMVLQTMFAPPFKWRFNRGTFSFITAPAQAASIGVPATGAQCDYPMELPDFGDLEGQWLKIGVGPAEKVHALSSKFSLSRPTGSAGRPTMIAAQYDDGSGGVTFRVDLMPDQAYTIEGEYQKKAPILTSLASKISPVPDEFAFIFNWGFLTIASMLVDDPRFPIWEKYFIGRLLGTQDGLDESDVNLFLGLWQTNTKTALRTQNAAQAGAAGRGN